MLLPEELRDAAGRAAAPTCGPSSRAARGDASSARRRCSAPAGPRDAARPRRRRTTPFGRFVGEVLRRAARRVGDRGRAARRARAPPAASAGTARIISSIADAGRLQPGDILVAETTAPPWTPLFATVAAVVTDTGGVLSHCAVVAREYGDPGGRRHRARRRGAIADGQRIEVDGDAGIVRIL